MLVSDWTTVLYKIVLKIEGGLAMIRIPIIIVLEVLTMFVLFCKQLIIIRFYRIYFKSTIIYFSDSFS